MGLILLHISQSRSSSSLCLRSLASFYATSLSRSTSFFCILSLSLYLCSYYSFWRFSYSSFFHYFPSSLYQYASSANHCSSSCKNLRASSSLFFAASSSCFCCSEVPLLLPLPPTVVILFLNILLRRPCCMRCDISLHIYPSRFCIQISPLMMHNIM